MGLLLSKLLRKKSSLQELENVDSEIKYLEECQKGMETARRRTLGRFVLFSVIIYVLFAFIFYYFFFPASFYDRLYYILPLIAAPVLIFILKRTLAWYFNRKITKAQTKLAKLHEKKKTLLNRIMETETYNRAKKILEKYPIESKKAPMGSFGSFTPTKAGLRHRITPTPKESIQLSKKPIIPMSGSATLPRSSRIVTPSIPYTSETHPIISKQTTSALQSVLARPSSPPQTPSFSSTVHSLPTPKTILPRERTILDKMVDYLVGDGPSNRYALICKYCFSHNGMALKEEAKYTAFRCCYCFAFNPALNKKPAAPKLELRKMTSPPKKSSESSDSESEHSPVSDADKEKHSRRNSKADSDYNFSASLEEAKISDTEKFSDFDKLSDMEQKMSELEHGLRETMISERKSSIPTEIDQPTLMKMEQPTVEANEHTPMEVEQQQQEQSDLNETLEGSSKTVFRKNESFSEEKRDSMEENEEEAQALPPNED